MLVVESLHFVDAGINDDITCNMPLRSQQDETRQQHSASHLALAVFEPQRNAMKMPASIPTSPYIRYLGRLPRGYQASPGELKTQTTHAPFPPEMRLILSPPVTPSCQSAIGLIELMSLLGVKDGFLFLVALSSGEKVGLRDFGPLFTCPSC